MGDRRKPRPRRVAAAAAAGVLVAAGAVAWLAQDGPGQDLATSAVQGALVDPGVVHVHGLGVDPADGSLYAATHSGLFRLTEEGEAERVGESYQDTMGFTVTGPRTFLGSGHPDPREDDVRPPLLGLVRSTDGGRTWERVSLHGKADFHALEAAHGRVYGYDATSGTFMVSEDLREWERRAQLPLRDLAVSPSDPETVLATTERGLARSTDGGRGWSLLAGAPALAVLSWAAPDSLYGVTPDGVVQHSSDGGATWAARGDAGGPPEAVTAGLEGGREVLHVAVTGRGVVTSADGGRSFTVRYAAR